MPARDTDGGVLTKGLTTSQASPSAGHTPASGIGCTVQRRSFAVSYSACQNTMARVPFAIDARQARASASQSPAPAQLPRNTDQIVVIAGACRDTAAGVQLDRVLPVCRDRQGSPYTPVPLKAIVQNTIDRRAAAGKARGIERSPDTGAKAADQVPLQRVEWALRALAAAEEIVVIGEERDRCLAFQRLRPEGLRYPNVRLEGPAVDADVDQLAGVVLAPGRRYPQSSADDQVLLPIGKLLQVERPVPRRSLSTAATRNWRGQRSRH